MKLSTLLLSSAALVVAGSAFAADLPAKKGAPAAKAAATGCPAFGAGFFQIPGGDNCIKFTGSVYADTTAAAASTTINGTYDLYFDVRSNSEGGVVRGYAGISGGTVVDKAYVQYAGLSAGKQTNLTKISGLGLNQGGTGYNNPSQSIQYSLPVGSGTFAVGVSNPASHSTQTLVTTVPDVSAQLSMATGPATIKVAGATHVATDQSTNTTAQGYVGMANLSIAAGNGLTIIGYGAYANGATSYIYGDASAVAYRERASNNNLTGTAAGIGATYAMGNTTVGGHYRSAAVQGATATQTSTQASVFASITAAKGLRFDPEFVQTTVDTAGDKTTSNTMYLRIARDF